MIHGIGIDIVEVSRFERFLSDGNLRIIDRLFTSGEQETCRAKKNRAYCCAARFAAKEAFLKALGTGLRNGITWHDMEILNDPMGKPWLFLSGEAENVFKRLCLAKSFLSISHDGGKAVAMVVLEAI